MRVKRMNQRRDAQLIADAEDTEAGGTTPCTHSGVLLAETYATGMNIEETLKLGYKIISTRFMRDHNMRQTRLAVQAVRKGAVSLEHW
eukprot:1875798-Amphidinium_carterae.1